MPNLIPLKGTTSQITNKAIKDGQLLVDTLTGAMYIDHTSGSSTSRVQIKDTTKSSVSFSRNLTSGTKIGTLTVNGTATDLYSPGTSAQGTDEDLGLTKLYSKLDDTNTDGTITQAGLYDLLYGSDGVTDQISNSYNDLKNYIDDKLNGTDDDDNNPDPTTPKGPFATVKYVDEEDGKIRVDLTQYHEELVSAVNDINTRIDGIDTLDISDYVRTTEKDNLPEAKLLELGYVSNPYIQKINTDSIAFYQGDAVMASIHDNKIETNNINVKSTITLGDETTGTFEVLIDSTSGLIIK